MPTIKTIFLSTRIYKNIDVTKININKSGIPIKQAKKRYNRLPAINRVITVIITINIRYKRAYFSIPFILSIIAKLLQLLYLHNFNMNYLVKRNIFLKKKLWVYYNHTIVIIKINIHRISINYFNSV